MKIIGRKKKISIQITLIAENFRRLKKIFKNTHFKKRSIARILVLSLFALSAPLSAAHADDPADSSLATFTINGHAVTNAATLNEPNTTTTLTVVATATDAGATVGAITGDGAITAGTTRHVTFTVTAADLSTTDYDVTVIVAAAASAGGGSYSPPVIPVIPTATVTSPVVQAVTSSEGGKVQAQIAGLADGSVGTISVVIPPAATTQNISVSVLPTSNGSDATPGYIAVTISAVVTIGGAAVTTFAVPLAITIPAGAPGSTAAWSVDGFSWTTMTQLSTVVLPEGLSDGFYINPDGTYLLLTRHLTIFGFRKAQGPLSAASTDATVQLTKTTQLSATGGSGTGAIHYATTTPTICSVSEVGLVTGISVGTCLMTAQKLGSGIYLDVKASTLSIVVSDSEAKAAAAQQIPVPPVKAPAAFKMILRSKLLAKGQVQVDLNLGSKFGGRLIYLKAYGKNSKNGLTVAKVKLNQDGVASVKISERKVRKSRVKVIYGTKDLIEKAF